MTIEERLERLERQNRWMRMIGAVALAVVAAVVLAGQAKAKPRVVEAERVVLKDRQGRDRASLFMAGTGDRTFPGLVFKDENGRDTIQLFGGSEPGLAAVRPGARMELGFDVGGNPFFLCTRWKGGHLEGRWFSLTLHAGNVPVFTTFDKTGKLVWTSPRE